jgi:cyclophilin family peptidyl-prolyl cis-trans isomerase
VSLVGGHKLKKIKFVRSVIDCFYRTIDGHICAVAMIIARVFLISLVANIATVKAEPTVRLDTNMGVIEINLRPDVAPIHVENFLQYVNDGDYNNSFIHRSIAGFIVQGGGFIFTNQLFDYVPVDPAIVNEFALSNIRGTVAMAKVGSDPNSATSQWFINLADNASNLDFQNGGFTVFGEVSVGMDVADAIAALPTVNFGAPIGSALPMRNMPNAIPVVWESHLVMINNAEQKGLFIPMLPNLFYGVLAAFIFIVGNKIRVRKKGI